MQHLSNPIHSPGYSSYMQPSMQGNALFTSIWKIILSCFIVLPYVNILKKVPLWRTYIITVQKIFSSSAEAARRRPKEIDAKVNRAADILDLRRLLDRFPRQLSGGQRQRVAMGRAIVRDPQVFPVRRAAVQSRRQAARGDAHRDRGTASTIRRPRRSTSPTTRSKP